MTARRAARRRRRAAVASALLGVLVAVVLVGLVLRLTASDDVEVNIGDEAFEVGKASSLARTVRRNGPLLFQDLQGGDLDVYVQHSGGRATAGWRAFQAHRPGAPRRCQVEWQPRRRQFLDPCTKRTFGADGEGLRQFPTKVDANGTVVVDFRE
jgi:hypothetical protein